MAKRKNREYGTMKTKKFMNIQATPNVFEFFELHACDETGHRRSRGKILELLIVAVGSRLEQIVPRDRQRKAS